MSATLMPGRRPVTEDAVRAGSRPHEVDLVRAGRRLMQVLLLTDEIKNVGGIPMEALALELGGGVLAGVPRRPGRGGRTGIRHRR